MKTEIGSLRPEFHAELSPIKESIARLEVKVDHLDRDVQILSNRQFGEGTG